MPCNELLTIPCCCKNFMMISQMVLDLSHWQTKQTHIHKQTLLKKCHLHYAIVAWVATGRCIGWSALAKVSTLWVLSRLFCCKISKLRLLTLNSLRKLQFLPRDAMHKAVARRMPSCGVCVCVSVTFVDHVKMNKDIFKIFSPSGSHTILVFLCQTA